MKTAAQLGILLVLWIAVFFPVFTELITVWLDDSNHSHGFLVPVIALYFTWTRREIFRRARPGSHWSGGVLLALALTLYLLGTLGDLAVLNRVTAVIALAGLVLFCLGREYLRATLFPICFLLFMVPVPDSLTRFFSLPLQTFATGISARMIELASVPVYQEGNMLYFVQTQLEVAESCSGIRSIAAMLMLAVMFMAMLHRGWSAKLVLLVSAVPLAIAANILRISGTGILAHYYGDKVARGFMHEFSGMAVFVFGLIVLSLEFLWLERKSGNRSGWREAK
jgi:exosortase